MVDFNKRFLYAAARAPGSTHDARLLEELNIYSNFRWRYYASYSTWWFRRDSTCYRWWQCLPPQYEWLLKMYNVNTRDEQQKYFNKRLCGAKVITENAYGMLKGRWRFLYKKNHNVNFPTYVTSSWHVLHCITFVLAGPILANLIMARSWAVGINRKAPFLRRG